MLRLCLLTGLFAFALFAQTAIVCANGSSQADAINSLLHRINNSQVYAQWLKPGCMSVSIETKTSKFYAIALHEKHGGKCEGDPNTAPVIDHFRVTRINNNILWYDIVNDQYLPFQALVKYRKSIK